MSFEAAFLRPNHDAGFQLAEEVQEQGGWENKLQTEHLGIPDERCDLLYALVGIGQWDMKDMKDASDASPLHAVMPKQRLNDWQRCIFHWCCFQTGSSGSWDHVSSKARLSHYPYAKRVGTLGTHWSLFDTSRFGENHNLLQVWCNNATPVICKAIRFTRGAQQHSVQATFAMTYKPIAWSCWQPRNRCAFRANPLHLSWPLVAVLGNSWVTHGSWLESWLESWFVSLVKHNWIWSESNIMVTWWWWWEHEHTLPLLVRQMFAVGQNTYQTTSQEAPKLPPSSLVKATEMHLSFSIDRENAFEIGPRSLFFRGFPCFPLLG